MARNVSCINESLIDPKKEVARQRLFLSTVVIIFLIPSVIGLGVLLFKEELYLPMSMLILFLTMAPFFMIFEKRKPKAREIVLIATVSALTLASHIFLTIVFPVHIGTAMVIIGGVALGPEAGFLIGALSRFICNFYMGQGPWTPWQMFCWGLLGFLAGLAFNKIDMEASNPFSKEKPKSLDFKVILGPVITMIFAFTIAYLSFLLFPGTDEGWIGWRLYVFGFVGLLAGVLLQKKRLPVDRFTLSLFTFFTVFVIYGGIMNIAAMVTTTGVAPGSEISWKALKLLYISGASYDAIHGITASICIFLMGEKIIKKLERIKIKYGIYK